MKFIFLKSMNMRISVEFKWNGAVRLFLKQRNKGVII